MHKAMPNRMLCVPYGNIHFNEYALIVYTPLLTLCMAYHCEEWFMNHLNIILLLQGVTLMRAAECDKALSSIFTPYILVNLALYW